MPVSTTDLQMILIETLWDRNLEAFKWVLSRSIDLNFEVYGNGPIGHAIHAGAEYVSLLINHGAQLEHGTKNYILEAAISHKFDVVKVLVESFPEAQKTLLEPSSSLNVAIRNQDRLIAKELIKILQDNGNTEIKYSPLHKAVEWNQKDLIPELVKQNPHLLNEKDSFGHTPLHLAVLNNNSEIGALLVQHGADPKIAHDNGQNAFDLAYHKALPELIKSLQISPKTVPTWDDAAIFVKDTLPEITQEQFNGIIWTHWLTSFANGVYQLADVPKSNGFSNLLKNINLDAFSYLPYKIDASGVNFSHCKFKGKLEGFHTDGIIKDSVFSGFNCNDCHFDPGSVIINSVFQNGIFKNSTFDITLMANNSFFYTQAENTTFNKAMLYDNQIYGSQWWKIHYDPLIAHDMKIEQSLIMDSPEMLDNVTIGNHTKPFIGVLGEATEISNFSEPGFLMAEPYLRILQADALPVMISKYTVSSLFDIGRINSEIDAVISHPKQNGESIPQQILHSDSPEINKLLQR